MSQLPALSMLAARPEAERPRALRFGLYELDVATLELRKAGRLLKLQQQPAKVLALLALRAGDLVTRDEIQREVWAEGTFVDFEQGLNFCIRQIRSVLGDNAEAPRYVETLPRRGYRFVAPVESVAETLAETTTPAIGPALEPPPARSRFGGLVALAALLATVVGVAASRDAGRRAPAPPASRSMLAILPFANLSNDPAQDYLTDGLTEELITRVARVAPERLGVIARTSSMQYKGVARGVDEIGRALGVDYLVEGSVRESGAHLRVTAQLIQVSDQTHLWAQSYDTTAADSLSLERDAAGRIVNELVDRLLTTGKAVAARTGTSNGQAYDAWLKGRYHIAENTEPSLRRAIAELQQATALDPGYAAAWASQAEAWVALGDQLLAPSRESYPKAKEAAERALALDDTQAEAWVWLGIAKAYYEWDLESGREAFDRALALDPGLAIAHHYYGDYLAAMGRWDDAVASVKRAQVLDPLSRPVNEDVGWYLYFARRYKEAAEAYLRTAELVPDVPGPHVFAANAYAAAGDWPSAVREAGLAMKLAGQPQEKIDRFLAGGGEPAVKAFARGVLEFRQRYKGAVPAFAAGYYAYLGDTAGALDDLERAQRERWRYLLVTVGADPDLERLRDEPRYRAVRKALGLPEAYGPS